MKLNTQSDEELIDAFRRGERAALGELARRYERPLLGLARGLLGYDDQGACDAIQETWVRVIRFAGSFNGQSRFRTWLYRVAINQCRNLWAARPKAVIASDSEPVNIDSEPPPDHTASEAEYAERVRAAVEALSPEARAVVLLCYHSGMNHAQAAEILEIPVGTVKSRLHAALEELRARLKTENQP